MVSFLGCMQMSSAAEMFSASDLAMFAGAPQSHNGGWFALAGKKSQIAVEPQVAVLFSGCLLEEQWLRRQVAAELPSDCNLAQVLARLFAKGKLLDWLSRLNGPFALAMLNLAERKLCLARDQHGQQSLFYGQDEQSRLWFADSLPQLRQGLGMSSEVDYQALADYLTLGYVPAPKTIYAKINKLPAGSKLLAKTDKNVVVEKFWCPQMTPKLELTWEEAALETRRLLTEAVQRCHQAAPTAGILLSGGVDSNLLLGLMAGQKSSPRTFTVGFAEPAFDERPLASMAAQRIGAEHHEAMATPRDLKLLPCLMRLAGEPFADASLVPTTLALQLATASCSQVFTGVGGDELFAGYRRYQYMICRANLDSLPLQPASWTARLLLPLVPAMPPPRTRLSALRRLLEAMTRPALAAYASFQEVFSPDLLSEIASFPLPEDDLYRQRWPQLLQDYNDLELVEQVNALDLLQYLPDDGCRKMTLAQKFAGNMTLAPILDREMTMFALSLPRKFRVNPREGKRLLKKIGRELMPSDIRRGTKKGFGVPVANWLQNEWAPQMRDMADSCRQWDQQGWLQQQTLQKLVREHLEGKKDHGTKLWNLYCLKTWLEQN